MAEEEEKPTPAAEEVDKNEDAAKEGDTKNEEDTLPEPTEVDEGAIDKAEPEQLGSSDIKEANLTSNPKQSLGVDPVVQPLLTGSTCIFKLIYDSVFTYL